MVNGLSIAEQYVDRRARTEMFRGRLIELVTARVVLHAVDDRGQPSTWLHMSTCALEYHSLGEILGPTAAAAELRQHTGYAWIYGQILADPDWFAGFLHRHGLRVPRQPPVPRRLVSEPLWVGNR